MIVELPLGDARWNKALPVLQSLRPHLSRQMLEQVLREGAPQGLRYSAWFDRGVCIAVVGWRVEANSSSMRRFYIEDLAIAPNLRNQGLGKQVFNEIVEKAQELRCNSIEMKAAVQRFATHRFLIRERMDITAHHFVLRLDADD